MALAAYRACRLIAGQSAEAVLQRAQRHSSAGPLQPVGPAEITGFERGGQPFVQPRRNAAGGECSNHRVRELVRQHALEFRAPVQGAAHRHANGAVVGARRP